MRIALVIGHDAEQRGAYGNAGISEFTFNDELIAEMYSKNMLPEDTYVLYRSADINGYSNQMIDLHKRIDKLGCEVSIEMHFNSFSNPSANGNEVLYCSTGGKKIADVFDEEMDILPNRDRGVKKVRGNDRGAGFCCRGKSKAIILEPFFGSRQTDYVFGMPKRDLLMKAISNSLKRLT